MDQLDITINQISKYKYKYYNETLSQAAKIELISLQNNFVITPLDKAAQNYAFICKKFYVQQMAKELGFLDNVLYYL